MCVCYFRRSIEFLVYYCILSVFFIHLKFTRHAIAETCLEKINKSTFDHMPYNAEDIKIEETLLSAICTNANTCSKLINVVFNLPMSVFVASSNFYIIDFVYLGINIVVAVGTKNLTTVIHFTVTILPGLLALILIARAGQRVHNNAQRIAIALAQLLNLTIPGSAHYKVLRRIIRVSSSHPVRVVLFGSQPVGHTLLPTSIGIITTYIIIVLHFKRIL